MDRPHESLIGNSVLQEANQPSVVHVVEETLDVGLYTPLSPLPHDNLVNSTKRVMCAFAGSEAKRAVQELWFPNSLQDLTGSILDDPVLEGRDPQRPVTVATCLGDVHAAHGLWPVATPSQPGREVCQPITQTDLVVGLSHAIDSGRLVLGKAPKAVGQAFFPAEQSHDRVELLLRT